jgi:glycosyltransferase involved in cell wall biosynthesis
MITVRLVSKPVAPPWNDATTVLVHGILANRASCRYRFFGTPASHVLETPDVTCDVVAAAHRFQPSPFDQVRTLARLAWPAPSIDVYHCLFTPNRKTSTTLRLALGLKRRPVVQTLCSSPDDWSAIASLLFADRVVAVSAWARRQLESQGVRGVVHIPPGITPLAPSTEGVARLRQQHDMPESRPLLLFAGDYEFSGAHPAILGALPDIVREVPDAIVVFACRTKTPHAVAIENDVRSAVAAAGLSAHVRFLRQVDDFASLLAMAAIILFPVQSLLKKMDLPLVLLQAMALRRPLITSTYGPLPELLESDAGIGVPPGDAAALATAAIALLKDPSRRQEMGARAHAVAVERYSASRMAAEYERLYISLGDPEK